MSYEMFIGVSCLIGAAIILPLVRWLDWRGIR